MERREHNPADVSGKDRLLPLRFIRGRKNVFLDWQLVEPGYGMPFWKSYQDKHGTYPWFSPYGVTLATAQPEIHPAPFIDKDPLGVLKAYSTLIHDDGIYRLWYETDGGEGKGDLGAILCTMQSKDCTTWHRPKVGLIEFNGSKDNNVVYGYGPHDRGGLTGAHGATVFKDPCAPAAERYKLIHIGPAPEGEEPFNWLYGAVSRDGLDWKQLPEPLVKHSSDTQSVGHYDETLDRYVLYLRGWSPLNRAGTGGRRVVKRTESADFRHFPLPETVLEPEPSWNPATDIYTNAYHCWPEADEAHLMLPALYYRDSDTVDVHLAVSRDGKKWFFPDLHPLVSMGNRPVQMAIYAGKGLVPFGEDKWAFPVYYSRKGHNEYSDIRPGLHLATLRQDGFIFLEAALKGEFSTYPALFDAARLVVNSFSYPGGEIRVELLEAKSGVEYTPVPGFTIKDCDGITGDSHCHIVRWKGREDLAALTGKVVRMRFVLIRSKLYSFTFL